MDPAKYEYQSDFARRYVAQGRVEMIITLLTARFGTLNDEARARIAAASLAELEAIGKRLLDSKTLPEALN